MNDEKKFLKLTAKGFEMYNGPIGVYIFKDGQSVETIGTHERDRISANIRCVEVSENGREVVAGVSERLVSESTSRAPVTEPLKRQSASSKVDEEVTVARGDLTPRLVHTEEELDAIIESGGIQGLRKVGDEWNVKNRSIPALKQMILDEQETWLAKDGVAAKRQEDMLKKVEANTKASNPEKTPADENVAAKTGDMSVAISKVETE